MVKTASTMLPLGTAAPDFSLPNPIETRVAEMIVERIPCAEKVRFGKNGSDQHKSPPAV